MARWLKDWCASRVFIAAPQVFAMGDDLVGVIANQFISMPIWVMMGQIVPDGAEGSIFALVSSLQTVGSTVGGSISAILTASLGVSLVSPSALVAVALCFRALAFTVMTTVASDTCFGFSLQENYESLALLTVITSLSKLLALPVSTATRDVQLPAT